MGRTIIATLVNGFFVFIFLAGTVLNVLDQDYLQAVGFALLALANLPTLMHHWTERASEPGVLRLANLLSVVGLGLVALRWLGIV